MLNYRDTRYCSTKFNDDHTGAAAADTAAVDCTAEVAEGLVEAAERTAVAVERTADSAERIVEVGNIAEERDTSALVVAVAVVASLVAA